MPESRPIALTVAGSDSGGGAGIQADLQTFAGFGVHGTSVITCLTAQNPAGVMRVEPVTPAMVTAQLHAIFAELRPGAVKTGMLYSVPILRAVAAFFQEEVGMPLVVDPVMLATSGAALMQRAALAALRDHLLPRATLVTPNCDEAEAITGLVLREPEDLRRAARKIREDFGCAVLVKGGHLRKAPEALDVFWDGREELLLRAPFVRGVSTHGTGCTYAAAIVASLARGQSLDKAVIAGKRYITEAIAGSERIGRHWVLGWTAARPRQSRR